MATGNDRGGALVVSNAPHSAKKVYKASAPAEQHVAALARMHDADKDAERAKTRFGWLTGIGVGVFVLGGIAAVATQIQALEVVPVIGGLLTVGSLIGRVVFGAADIDDRKLHAAQQPLEALAPEMRSDRPVELTIDFGGYQRTKPISNSTSTFRPTGQLVFRKADWLDMRFFLLDGTAVRVSVSTTAKRKQRAKRKYTKIKDRVVDDIVVQLKAPAGRALRADAAAGLAKRFKPRNGMTLKSCRIKDRVAELHFRAGPGIRISARAGWQGSGLNKLLDGDKLLDAIIFAYNATAVAARAAA